MSRPLPSWRAQPARALDVQSDELRLDLTGLTFMDSFGARAIIHAHNTAELLGARLVILSPAHEVRRMLELMGLDRVMRIRD
jgi:anti-anti-sigma factor